MASAKLDSQLITKAVNELLKFETSKTNQNSLLGEHAKPVLAQVQLKETIKAPVVRPVRVKIPHSLFSSAEEDHTICLFCRTEDKAEITEYIKEHHVDGLTTVMSVSEVKKQSAAFKDRKKLLADHTHFVCDAAVLSLLYNLLGKVFGSRNNYPIPVDMKVMDKLGDSISKAVNASTYVHLRGQNLSIRFGHTHMKGAHIAKNIVDGLEFAVENKIKTNWKAIHSVHLKTSDSASIPIYSKNSEHVMKFVQEAAAKSTAAPTPAKAGKKEVKTPAKAGKTLAVTTPAKAEINKSAVKSAAKKVSTPKAASIDAEKSSKRKAEPAVTTPSTKKAKATPAKSSTPAPTSATKAKKPTSAKKARA